MIGVLLAGLWVESLVENRPEAADDARDLLGAALRALAGRPGDGPAHIEGHAGDLPWGG